MAEGKEGIEKLKAAMDEISTGRGLISPQQIAEAAELNDKVEALAKKIDVEFKQAFIAAGPAVLQVAQFIERMTSATSAFLAGLPDFLRGVNAIAHFDLLGIIGKALSIPSPGVALLQSPIFQDAVRRVQAQGAGTRLRDQAVAGLASGADFSFEKQQVGQRAGVVLGKPKDGKKPSDVTADEDAKAQNALLEARKSLADATKADAAQERAHTSAATILGRLQEQLTDAQNVQDAAFAEAEAERNKQLAKVEQDEAKIRKARPTVRSTPTSKRSLPNSNWPRSSSTRRPTKNATPQSEPSLLPTRRRLVTRWWPRSSRPTRS